MIEKMKRILLTSLIDSWSKKRGLPLFLNALILIAFISFPFFPTSVNALGIWLLTTTVKKPAAFKEYVQEFKPWLKSVGGSLVMKDSDPQIVEGRGGKLSVVISFPSKQAAIDAYNSPEYKELTKKRWASTKKTNLIIIGLNKWNAYYL